MGVFADFLTSRPSSSILDRRVREELEELRDRGDPDAPAGFTGRTSYAVLKVIGATDILVPPPAGVPMGFRTPSIDYSTVPVKNETLVAIANQAAIDENNPLIEQDLLVHLGLCRPNPGDLCSFESGPAFPSSGLIDNFVLEDQGLGDGEELISWPSNTGTDVLTPVNPAPHIPKNPTLVASAFNGRGGLRFDQNSNPVPPGDIVGLEHTNSFQPFADRTGTFAVVFQPEFPMIFSKMIDYKSGAGAQFWVGTRVIATRPFTQTVDGSSALETPAADLELGVPQLFLWWRDDDRIEFRRNGLPQTGVTLGTNPAPPAADTVDWFALSQENNSLDCTVARIMRWDRVLTLTELQSIEYLLMGLYL